MSTPLQQYQAQMKKWEDQRKAMEKQWGMGPYNPGVSAMQLSGQVFDPLFWNAAKAYQKKWPGAYTEADQKRIEAKLQTGKNPYQLVPGEEHVWGRPNDAAKLPEQVPDFRDSAVEAAEKAKINRMREAGIMLAGGGA